MDAGSSFILGIVLLLVIVLGLTFWLNGLAQRQYETQVPMSPAKAADIAADSFGSFLWKDVPGPGLINKRRRTFNETGPVVSVDVAPLPNGGSHVTVWMSAWTKKGLVILGSDQMIGRKRKIFRLLEQA